MAKAEKGEILYKFRIPNRKWMLVILIPGTFIFCSLLIASIWFLLVLEKDFLGFLGMLLVWLFCFIWIYLYFILALDNIIIFEKGIYPLLSEESRIIKPLLKRRTFIPFDEMIDARLTESPQIEDIISFKFQQKTWYIEMGRKTKTIAAILDEAIRKKHITKSNNIKTVVITDNGKYKRDKDLKPSYGKIIYNHFTKLSSVDKQNYYCGAIGGVVIIGLSIFVLSIEFLLNKEHSVFNVFLYRLNGVIWILIGILFIKSLVLDYHEYILFENGVLTSGYWQEKNSYFYFRDLKEVLFSPSKELILERVVPLFDKYKKNIPDYSWRYWGAEGVILIYIIQKNIL